MLDGGVVGLSFEGTIVRVREEGKSVGIGRRIFEGSWRWVRRVSGCVAVRFGLIVVGYRSWDGERR